LIEAAHGPRKKLLDLDDNPDHIIIRITLHSIRAPCGLRGCKNGPAPFPGRMSYKTTKPGLVFVLYLSMFIIVFGVY